MPDPENATAEQVNVERINVARAFADCKREKADLAKFVRGGKVDAPKKKSWCD